MKRIMTESATRPDSIFVHRDILWLDASMTQATLSKCDAERPQAFTPHGAPARCVRVAP